MKAPRKARIISRSDSWQTALNEGLKILENLILELQITKIKQGNWFNGTAKLIGVNLIRIKFKLD